VQLEQALADADVAKKLLQGTKNPTPLALKQPQVAQARASLRAAQVELQRAQLDLERTQLSVPFEGRVKSRIAGLGQFVTPGTPLGKVFATDRVEVRVSLTDEQLHSLGKPMGFVADDANQAPLVTFSYDMAGSTYFWNGYLQSVDAAVDNATRTVYGLAVLDKPYLQESGIPMAVGMYVNLKIQGRDVQQATLINAAGLRAGNVVFTIKDGLLHKNEVKVGYRDKDFVLIEEGVFPGQDVVVSPIRNPIEGMAAEPASNVQTNVAGSNPLSTASHN
jgi:RND family efflux transporter MFP subunit